MMEVKVRHLVWIDWMKIIGIYLIVWGHFFSPGHLYLYTFSVPLFFLISGFLCKEEYDAKVFWKKIFFNLVVPMMLIYLVNYFIRIFLQLYLNSFEFFFILKNPILAILGFHESLQELWFVYTLIILKILHYFSKQKLIKCFLFFLMPLCGYFLDRWNPHIGGWSLIERSNAIINATCAYPFFAMGNFLSKKMQYLNFFRNFWLELFLLLLSVFGVYYCTLTNGAVWLYINGYGNNFFLFLLGGVCRNIFSLDSF